MRAVVEGEIGSGAERSVLRLLSELDGPGVVVFNVAAHRKKGWDPVQIDAVLWTPQRCVAIEVKGLIEARGGALTATSNGAWKLDETPAPLYGLESHANAFQQVQAEALALTGALKWRLDRKEFVEGLVVVVPMAGHEVSVELSEPLRGTRLVIADDGAKLASAVAELSAGRRRWSASQVVAALRALNIGTDIDEAALFADGFPSEPDPPAPPRAPRRRRSSPHGHRAGRHIPRQRVVHAAARVMTPPTAKTAVVAPAPKTDAAVTAAAAAPTPAQKVDIAPATSSVDKFDAWDLAVSTDRKPPEPVIGPDDENSAPTQQPAQRSWRNRIRRSQRTSAPAYRRRKSRWYNPFWALGWVIGWVWARVRRVVGTVAVFVLGAAVLGGVVFLAGKVVASAFDTTGPQGPLAPVSMMTADGNIGCAIGTDSDGDFARCDVASYTYSLPVRPDDCAPQDFGHTVILRAGKAPAYACAQDFLLAGELPRSESMSSGKFSCTRVETAAITCRERGGHRFTISRTQFRTR
ncbi:NERD domain-containing protein [Nocardia puris]|uniref:NERD domain-containing protein n=1 Tax=Nocardia puris TaxID=208602 RepID=UPI0018941C47|nr:nuclease-related domain-containing protein [Nocardia puris]MBF6216162.1 NERD domain-containing protein [Nocardia puris]